MKSRSLLLVAVAVAAAVAAIAKRPVAHPERKGSWHPAEAERSPR